MGPGHRVYSLLGVDTCGHCNAVGILGTVNAALQLFWAGPGHKVYSLLGVNTCGDCNAVGVLGAVNAALPCFGRGQAIVCTCSEVKHPKVLRNEVSSC